MVMEALPEGSVRKSLSQRLIAEAGKGFPGAVGMHIRYRVVEIVSSRVRLLRPFDVDVLEFPDGTIAYLLGSHLCAFGKSPAETLSDLRSSLEARYEELRERIEKDAHLSGTEMEDWAVLRALLGSIGESAARSSSRTIVLSPIRLEDVGHPRLRIRRPVLVLLTSRDGVVHAMISVPLIEAMGTTVDSALELLRARIVQTYDLLREKGPQRSAGESDDFEAMSRWIERTGGAAA